VRLFTFSDNAGHSDFSELVGREVRPCTSGQTDDYRYSGGSGTCHPTLGIFTERNFLWRAIRGIVGILMLTTPALSAEIAWKKKSIELESDLGQYEIEAQYKFVNKGKEPVTILKVETDCDCTRADYTKTAIEPNAEGVINIVFGVGAREGMQHKNMWVTFDDQPNYRHQLKLTVDIPVLLDLLPSVLYWKAGDPLVAKTVEVKASKKHKVKIKIDPLKDDAPFTYEWKENKSGGTLTVTPKALDKRAGHEIYLTATAANGHSANFMVFLLVR
jgi:hypothetical protein